MIWFHVALAMASNQYPLHAVEPSSPDVVLGADELRLLRAFVGNAQLRSCDGASLLCRHSVPWMASLGY